MIANSFKDQRKRLVYKITSTDMNTEVCTNDPNHCVKDMRQDDKIMTNTIKVASLHASVNFDKVKEKQDLTRFNSQEDSMALYQKSKIYIILLQVNRTRGRAAK
jgi:hypothetical protein